MLNNILGKVGDTPIIPLQLKENELVRIYAKLEFYNPTGSVKDRAASYILQKILKDGTIDRSTMIIESSSGNFGVSLSAYTKLYGLKFICVIDEHTLPSNEMLIRSRGAEVIKISIRDKNGGFLLNRIKKIKQIMSKESNIYWVNQYENPLNAEAYYHSLGKEICSEAPDNRVDYVFLGVSSGGTISGVSRKVKEQFPKAKVIAVDIYGSVIFGQSPKRRFIPGIGSSLKPKIIQTAEIDEVVWVSETESVEYCKFLLREFNLYTGGSSGSVYAGIKKFFETNKVKTPVNVMCIMADRGERYASTIYNENWVEMIYQAESKIVSYTH